MVYGTLKKAGGVSLEMCNLATDKFDLDRSPCCVVKPGVMLVSESWHWKKLSKIGLGTSCVC